MTEGGKGGAIEGAGGSHGETPDSCGAYFGRRLAVRFRPRAGVCGRGTTSRGTGWPEKEGRRWEAPSRDRVRRDGMEGGRTKPGTRANSLSVHSPPTLSLAPIAREACLRYIRCGSLSTSPIATSPPTSQHPKQLAPHLHYHAQQTRLPLYCPPPCPLLCDAAAVMEPWHEGE